MAENVYPYTLIRSDRRTISIQIRAGEVIVRAPKRLAKREIDPVCRRAYNVDREPP